MDSEGASDKSGRGRARQKSALTMFADTSARIVQTAAGILEEEIAAGIAAAKEISRDVRDTVQGAPHLSKADYANLVERFRTDAHDVLEVLVTLFKAGTEAIAEVAKAAGSNRYTDRESSHVYSSSSGVPKYMTRSERSIAEEVSQQPQTGPTPRPKTGEEIEAAIKKKREIEAAVKMKREIEAAVKKGIETEAAIKKIKAKRRPIRVRKDKK